MFASHPIFKITSLLMLGVFFLVGGLSVSMGMTMQMDGLVSSCPFMHEGEAFCPMSLATHVAEWKQLSTAEPTGISMAAVALLLFVFLLYFTDRMKRQRVFFEHLRRRNAEVGVFAALFLAFSKGILSSRLFA